MTRIAATGIFSGAVSLYDSKSFVCPFVGSVAILWSDFDRGLFIMNAASSAVPEPSTLTLLGAGVIVLIGYRRWARKKAACSR